MNPVITVRNLTLGAGRPKICVPLTGRDLPALKSALLELKKAPFDLVEWRADFFQDLFIEEKFLTALAFLRKELGDVPLLFTVRTAPEGGNLDLSPEDYEHISVTAIKSGCIDLADVELMKGTEVMKALVAAAHEAGVKIVGSNHDFHATPKKEELVSRLCAMQKLGADLAKIAVMPQSPRDVLTLLDATLTMKEEHKKTPVVTMSMGRLGAISRASGELFGSCLTFGTAGAASAPGQLPAAELEMILRQLSPGETGGHA